MRSIGRINLKSIAQRYGLYKLQLLKRTNSYYLMAYTDPDDVGILIGLIYPYKWSDGTETTSIEAFYPKNNKLKKQRVDSVEDAIDNAVGAYVRDLRQSNPDFFTDSQGVRHPIRASADYDPDLVGEKPSKRQIALKRQQEEEERRAAQMAARQKHHIAVYNGKEVVIDYVADKKREFQVAAQRIRDNIRTGDKGYVLAPDGKKYEVTTSSRMAKLVK